MTEPNQTSSPSSTLAGKPVQLIKTRPAESSGVAAAIALLICNLLGVKDPNTLTALAIIIGFIPAAVTWIVELSRGKSA